MRRFSIIIPTLDEARRLPATLQRVRAAFGSHAEIIVADGGSSDTTRTIAGNAGARVVLSGRGRGEQLHRGFCAADGEICVFLHADTLLPITARAEIERVMVNRRVAGGAFSLQLDDRRAALRWLERAINLRTRLFRSATGDQAIFARHSVLREVGGVPRVPLFEDVRLCRALKRKGRFVILQDRVSTSTRLWQSVGATRGILLHLSFRALHALGASPAFLARFYPTAR